VLILKVKVVPSYKTANNYQLQTNKVDLWGDVKIAKKYSPLAERKI
jgi:hypothetical protein